jgi:nucleoside-diphosphate-sugar epimerase
MKILLTGATGFIGSHFLRHLSKRHEVVALARNREGGARAESMGASQVVFADITNPNFISGLPEGIDLLCHCAGILGKWNVPRSTYMGVHVNGTDHLLKACQDKKIKRVLYLSSAGVLGAASRQPGNEKSGYRPTNVYEWAKVEAEKNVLKFKREHGLDITVLRPEFVYGEGNMHILGLFKMIKAGKFFLINGGRGLLHPTYIGDLIQALDLVISSVPKSDIYMVAGERALTVREFVTIIAGLLNVPAPKLSVPLWVANRIAFLSELMAKIFHFDPILTHSRVDFFTAHRAYNTGLISSELGYRPGKLEEGLLRTLRWYIENGHIPK